MIHINYRGMGGQYTQYLRDEIKKANRIYPIELSSNINSYSGYHVAIANEGDPLTETDIRDFLENHSEITFHIGDSSGLPSEIIKKSNTVRKLSFLSLPHNLQIMIITQQIQQLLPTIGTNIKNDTVELSSSLQSDEDLDEVEVEAKEELENFILANTSKQEKEKVLQKFLHQCKLKGVPVDEISNYYELLENNSSQEILIQKWQEITQDFSEVSVKKQTNNSPATEVITAVKRGRGRPRKNPVSPETTAEIKQEPQPQTEKRGRGRPRKNTIVNVTQHFLSYTISRKLKDEIKKTYQSQNISHNMFVSNAVEDFFNFPYAVAIKPKEQRDTDRVFNSVSVSETLWIKISEYASKINSPVTYLVEFILNSYLNSLNSKHYKGDC